MGTGQEGKERPGGTGRPCEAVSLLDCREWEGAWAVRVGGAELRAQGRRRAAWQEACQPVPLPPSSWKRPQGPLGSPHAAGA